ncbi:MAG: hypothetical protein KC635_27760 [Myxococcales bacterium]|nr:hypothetical protein [Myxococcales bacterium]MCB9732837.1 hypothetical protein [Deltaproteobacteria bacterium]
MDDNGTRLASAEKLVEQAATLARGGDFGAAKRKLDEATHALEGVDLEADPKRLNLLASIHEGRGQIALATGDLPAAETQLTQAIAVLHREAEQRTGQPRSLHLAIAHLNLSATYGQMKRPDDALRENGAALEALGALDDRQNGFLRMASLQSRGVILRQLARKEQAVAAYDEAIALGDRLDLAGQAEAQELLTELRLTAALARNDLGAVGLAREHAQRAASEAWARAEAGQQRAVPQYLNAQMNLVAFSEAAGDFAAAEDALFRVLKLVGPEPRVVAHGRAMYQRLLALDDDALEAGNLPRDEVEDSLAELDKLATPPAPAQS